MLQHIREKLAGGIAIAILVLIGTTFVFFGVGDYSFLGQNYAASVDGSEIGINQFELTYRDQINANPALADLPEEFRLQVRQGVLDNLIRDRLIEMHVIEKGYRVSGEQLDRLIQGIPEFQIDGVFDEETAKQVLFENGFTVKRFRESQRRSMQIDQLRRAVGATALVTPSDYRRYLNLVAEQRLVTLATFDIAGAKEGIEVSDDDVAAFYAENDTMYLTEESVDIEMIEVRRDAVAGSVDISEEALQQYYEDEQSRYLQDEQRQARHILIPMEDDEDAAEELARSIAERAKAGEPFEDLAKTYSKDGMTASSGGDLGALTRTQLPGELGGAIFSMEEGDIAGPIESDFGFHVVRLDSIIEPGPLPLDQVRGDLLSELRDREAEGLFRDLENRMSDAVFDAENMQVIADATGLEIQTASGITRSGGGPVGSNQAALDAIFEDAVLTGGEITDIVELDATRSAVFRVTAYNEASRLPLEDVREQIVDTIKTRRAQTIVFDQAESLMAALDAGEDFGMAAEAAGGVVSQPTLLGRQTQDVEPAVRDQVFRSKKPTVDAPVRERVMNADGGYTVFNLEAVLPGRPESIPLADRDAGKLQLAQQGGVSDYVAFVQALYDNADIVISEDALAAQDLLQ
jgi:peptidyl-prolyl cis-trans isomerase D